MTRPDRPWVNTTHDWGRDLDVDHLREVRQQPERFAATGVLHLVLEVVAYAADEAEARGRRGRCLIRPASDGSILIVDDGRGTDTRRSATGAVVRKPIMATRDLRFFDADDPPRLGDGHARRGISVVAALSTSLVHVNRRDDGAWSQAYRDGLPVGHLAGVAGDGTTGTAVRFTACDAVRDLGGADVRSIYAGVEHLSELLGVIVHELR